jgi:hypothetical protein
MDDPHGKRTASADQSIKDGITTAGKNLLIYFFPSPIRINFEIV